MAGEIQLNSTTLATESSGSITAEVDTIRPNTTNGSLTLQGDSSDAGVTGLTIDSSGNATFAQTISGGTIGSSVLFPTGHVIQTLVEIDDTATSTADTTYVTPFTGINIPMSGNNKVLVMAFFTGFKTGSSSARGFFRLAQTVSATTTHYSLARDVGFNIGDIRMPIAMSYQTNALTSGSTYTFNVEFQSVSSSGTVGVNFPYTGAGNSILIVQEIKE